VDLQVADHDTLKAALESLGLKYREEGKSWVITTPAGEITIANGKAQCYDSGCQKWANKIKQSYSLKTIERISKKFKFNITTKPSNKLVLRRY